MNLEIFFNSILNIIATPIGFLYIVLFTQNWRYDKKKVQITFLMYFICTIVIDIILLILCEFSDFSGILIAVINSVSCFLLLLIIAKFEKGKLLFSFFSALIFIFISNTVSNYLLPTHFLYYLPSKIISKVLVDIIFLSVLKKYFVSPYASTTNRLSIHWGKMTLLPISICLLFYLIIVSNGTIYQESSRILPLVTLCITSILIYITLYYLLSYIQNQNYEQENKRIFKAQVEILENQLKHISEQEKANSFLNHDIRHYAHIIAACIRNEQYHEALEAVSSLFHQLEIKNASFQKMNFCENQIINASIGYWVQKAREFDIKIFTKLNISSNIAVDSMDLAIVFSNSIENAIHACLNLPEHIKGKIIITAQIVGKQLFIEIGNTYSGEIIFDSKTNLPLSNSPGHGIGTQSITAFVKKNNAVMSYHAQDGWFTLRMLI